MLPLEHPDRIQIAFDDHRLVNNAGLLLPVILAHHLGLGELVDRHVDLGRAPGRANAGDKTPPLTAMGIPWNWRPTTAATPRSSMPSETSSTASGSTISPRAASLPTEPGWRYRCWPITWPAGQRASVLARNW